MKPKYVKIIPTRTTVNDIYQTQFILNDAIMSGVNERYLNGTGLLNYFKQFCTYRAMLRHSYGETNHPNIGEHLKPHHDAACKDLGIDDKVFGDLLKQIETGFKGHLNTIDDVINKELK